jgi:hypothetical protein
MWVIGDTALAYRSDRPCCSPLRLPYAQKPIAVEPAALRDSAAGVNGRSGSIASFGGEVDDFQSSLDIVAKSFWGDERKFLEPLMRFARGNLKDHIVSSKIEHGPS